MKSFNKIAAPLTSILRTTAILSSLKNSPKTYKRTRQEVKNANANRAKISRVKLTKSKIAKTMLLGLEPKTKPFLTLGAKLAFIETLILHYFDPKCYICIKIDTSEYAIGRVLSQLSSDQYLFGSNKNFAKPSDIGQ